MTLFSIGPETPFLPRLATSWLDGSLEVGPVDDPLARIDTTFYLPTRRAARVFAEILTDALGGTALLPAIRTLADADEDEGLHDPEGDDADRLPTAPDTARSPDVGQLPLAISPLRRRLILSRLINAAGAAMRDAIAGTGSDIASTLLQATPEQLAFPQSLAESAHLAAEMADLLDRMATEERDWQDLAKLVPDDHAAYWQLTLTLLGILTDNWPAILEAEGAVDAATRRRLLLDARTASVRAGPTTGPIIAAGSTGSIPATARFLAAIADHPQGCVVLPGLDLDMAETAFERLVDDTPENASHPQHNLARLLATMKRTRADCRLLGSDGSRRKLVSAAFLPAPATGTWPASRPMPELAASVMEGADLLEASSEDEEALALAMAMKASVSVSETVALVTPDRALARRVQLEAERFGLALDDTAGTPLRETPPARLMLAAAEAWRTGFAAIPLLALLKHPLCALGAAPADTRRHTRLLERLVLRGIALPSGLEALRMMAALRMKEQDDAGQKPEPEGPQQFVPALRRTLSTEDADRVLALIDRLEAAFQPLADLGDEDVPFDAYVEALFAVSESIAQTDHAEALNPLYGGSAGEVLGGFRRQLREADTGLSAPLREAPALLETLLAEQTVRPVAGGDPACMIWGPLEARLQAVDHIILAGLNEQVWPNLPSASPLLSRGMMAGLGLESPEQRIGLSAHDVEMALGNRKVTLSRALKVDGTPTVSSRWLQRLLAFLPEETGKAMRHRAEPLLALARTWDRPDIIAERPRPEPRPARVPTRLSITDVEPLFRDPYSVYAKRVLRLEEAPGLGLAPGAAERGTLFHGLLEAVAPHLDAKPVADWQQAFEGEARTVLETLDPFPEIKALWARRLEQLAGPYLTLEETWSTGLAKRHAERRGALELEIAGTICRLTGRADRIDFYAEGQAAIRDFKTGATPSAKQVQLGLAPQLPLTAMMLSEGAFGEVPPLAARSADYVKIGAARDPVSVVSFDDAEELTQLAADARDKLTRLWASFLAGAPFTPLLRPEWVRADGTYHHLARVKEWRSADEAGDG
ncbi:MAG: double-strand break repair protein AddB [Pseudomonadota bacterium]